MTIDLLLHSHNILLLHYQKKSSNLGCQKIHPYVFSQCLFLYFQNYPDGVVSILILFYKWYPFQLSSLHEVISHPSSNKNLPLFFLFIHSTKHSMSIFLKNFFQNSPNQMEYLESWKLQRLRQRIIIHDDATNWMTNHQICSIFNADAWKFEWSLRIIEYSIWKRRYLGIWVFPKIVVFSEGGGHRPPRSRENWRCGCHLP